MKHKLKQFTRIGMITLALLLVVILGSSSTIAVGPSVSGSGYISFSTQVAVAAKSVSVSDIYQKPARYSGETYVETMPWGYRYTLSNGDTIEVGDSTTTDFKAYIKTVRWDGSVYFSLWLAGGTFVPTLNGLTVSFQFNSNILVSIYPVEPCERLPEGGIEYNVTLLSRPAQNTVTMNIDWQGITWQKILPLNVEYNETLCTDRFGVEGSPYIITPTSIVGSDNVTYKTRAEYEVNSYIGTAINLTKDTTIYDNGVSYTSISSTRLYIHRGVMIDSNNNTAWVEDITLNETSKTITFTLPRTWLRNATYPIKQVCGIDPAYTQTMSSFQSTAFTGGDGVWSDLDITAYAGDNVVVSLIMSNATSGTENSMGVRANGSSLSRYITSLHEAEGGDGETHCRMFVQTDATGIIECYHSDVSDADYFYVVGYWSNVAFTEANEYILSATDGSWHDKTLASSAANGVHHIIGYNGNGANGQDEAETLGVRANGASLERKLLVHESEAGGSNVLDWFVKADSSSVIELYSSEFSSTHTGFANLGYFGTEMDFVEKWQWAPGAGTTWIQVDITAYLDQDGRMTDWLIVHAGGGVTWLSGVRDGDDTTTNRYLTEHEAESAGAGGEYTGFGMSAKSNSTGKVYQYDPDEATGRYYLTGYFKPVAAGASYTANQTTYNFGIVLENSTNNTTGTWILFTNSSSVSTNITVKMLAATWTATANGWTHHDSAPNSNTAAMKANSSNSTTWATSEFIKFNAPYNQIGGNIAVGSNYASGLSLLAPSSFTNGYSNNNTVQFTFFSSS